MIPLRIIYDQQHTKTFNIKNKLYTFVYDFNYCKSIEVQNLQDLRDGYYTYVIHDNHQLKIAPVYAFENGSKHIQLVTGTAIPYIGGEFKKTGNTILLNTWAGLFRNTTPYNIKHHSNEFFDMLFKTFKRYKSPNIIYTEDIIIKDDKFINTGLWSIKNYKGVYYCHQDMDK